MKKEAQNVVIYIDYENVHYNLINDYKNVFQENFFEKLNKYCRIKNLQILDIILYCNFDIDDMRISCHQTKLQQYGLTTRHTSNNGKNYADIQIAVDAMEQMNDQFVDGFIIITNDKDMSPLIKKLRKNKEFVWLITTKKDYDRNLLRFPTGHDFLENILRIDINIQDDEYQFINVKTEILESLKSYIKKFYIDSSKEPNVGVDFYINNSLTWTKFFDYEIIRNLWLLEKEGEVLIHKYTYLDRRNNSQSALGIIPKEFVSYLPNFQHVPNHFNEIMIKDVYDKYR
jgi:uncharacterized LabA/DUF88 family protein